MNLLFHDTDFMFVPSIKAKKKMTNSLRCQVCDTRTAVLTPVEHRNYAGRCMSCAGCARALRESMIDQQSYPPPNCWVTVKGSEGEVLDAVLIDLLDDDKHECYVYGEDGAARHCYVRFENHPRTRYKNPRYQIPLRWQAQVKAWVEEIER